MSYTLAWATDVHLNFLDEAKVAAYARRVAEVAPDAVLITGDIAEAHDLEPKLTVLDEVLARPIWFVLGNHDFYRGSIEQVRRLVVGLRERHPRLGWLPVCGVVPLGEGRALVGVDGWGDARLGRPESSRVWLNDFRLIADLQGLVGPPLWSKLRALGDAEAATLAPLLEQAAASHAEVVVATHVPPFREACWHEGKVSDDEWLPYFTCRAVGNVLLAAARARPEVTFTVYCGHTHGGGVSQLLPNLTVHTGGARYGTPEFQCLSFPG